MTGPPAIEARSLVKTYPGGVRALDGLTFAVEGGTVFGLVGPNGAGKSTAVKILTTLSRPDAGSARVGGLDVLGEPDRVREAIGCVGQRSGVDREATGRENLLLQGRLYGLRGRALEERVDGLLERFGLAEAADRLGRGYSGGMQRRLDVAMGLVHRPRVLFLDEPTTGLDPEIRAAMWSEISRLAEDEGLTILLTTHYMEEADRLAARVAVIDRGRVVASGSPEELKGELRGDALHIELEGRVGPGARATGLQEPGAGLEGRRAGHRDEAADRIRRALAGVDGLREILVDGRSLHARAAEGARAVPVVLQALESEGFRVASVTVTRPSLEDVYLRHTGRMFEEADAELEAPRRSNATGSRRRGTEGPA